MRLVSFSVKNFRSITDAHRIPIEESSVIIGRNNEGKSNILRALNIAMKALTAHASSDTSMHYAPSDSHTYDWHRDFPISLQGRTRGLESILILEFSLNEKEVHEFREKTKSNLNGTLPIEIRFGKSGSPDVTVRKQGVGKKKLSAKSTTIAKYIAEHIHFVYIPAIRTENDAIEVVQEMLSAELAALDSNPEYTAAVQKITELQRPVLDKVSKSILDSLRRFLPNIKTVTVRVPPSARRVAFRSQCKIEVDDGSRTLLDFKGDGVKSLAALGLLKDRYRPRGASIVAIEEPESHLHPGAIHRLREVIDALAADNQVVITTHCPLFVDRQSISRNILIGNNTAKPAPDIAAIRNLLGVQASDNLVNASHVLVVEGEKDVVALRALFTALSPALGKAMKNNRLVLEQIGGAGNLAYKLTTLANALCVTHVLLDNDEAGNKAYSKAVTDGLLKPVDATLVNCQGMPTSELEDIFSREIYERLILEEFGVNLNDRAFRSNKKWSDRVKSCFEKQGKHWSGGVESHVKTLVATAVARNPSNALNEHKRSILDALVSSLERKLKLTTLKVDAR